MTARTCESCGGPLRLRTRAQDLNRRLSREWFTYDECAHCRSVFIDSIPADLGAYYPSDYYGAAFDPEFFRSQVEGERYRIELLLPFQDRGRLVEIGAGPGLFTRLALDAGFQVEAIEYSQACCDFLRREQGIVAHCTNDPASVALADSSIDVVAFWHSLEHIPRPFRVLEAAARWLRPGGVMLIATPNPESLQFRLLGKYWPHLDAPRHVAFPAIGELKRHLAVLGFERKLLTLSDPGGLHWNRFGWQQVLANWTASRVGRFGRTATRIGTALSWLFAPLERTGTRGATYTCIFRKRS